MIKNKDSYYTTHEVALELGFTPAHVRRLILKGKIKAEKLGNSWLIKKQTLKFKRQRFPRQKEESHGSCQ